MQTHSMGVAIRPLILFIQLQDIDTLTLEIMSSKSVRHSTLTFKYGGTKTADMKCHPKH